MTRLTIVAAMLTLLLVAPAAALTGNYAYSGSGNLIDLDPTPIVYSGVFTYGAAGTWQWEIDDSAWAGADSTSRFDYIWSTYFAGNYDDTTPGAEAWTGYFPGTFQIDLTSPDAGHMEGSIDIAITIRDRDLPVDGILSMSEKHHINLLNADYLLDPDLGTGAFTDHCGNGSLGTYQFKFINPPYVNTIGGSGLYSSYQCQSPVEDSSWSMIKALYR